MGWGIGVCVLIFSVIWQLKTETGKNYMKGTKIKGISYVTNGNNERIAIQIDLKTLEKHPGWIEDFLDGIIAESRKDEEKIPLSKVVDKLKKTGKLK